MTETTITHCRRSAGRWRCATFVLLTLCVILIISFVAVTIYREKLFEERMTPTCSGNFGVINLEIPDEPDVFHDLTPTEIKKLQQYLYSQPSLNLVEPEEAAVNKSYIFIADLHLPNKEDVLVYLDKSGDRPPREAKVIIFRGDKVDPDIEEYIVGPLPTPDSHHRLGRKRSTPIPFRYRPVTKPELNAMRAKITKEADEFLTSMLREKYNATFTNCGNACLSFHFLTMISESITGEDSRKMWFSAYHFVEFFIVNPIDFSVLIRLDNKVMLVEKVLHSGKEYDSFSHLQSQYENGLVNSSKMPFPKVDKNYFSTMNQRGTRVPEHPTRNPRQIEPDGKRYSVQGRHVSYMDWDFDFRMAVVSGPQLFDIKFRKERIAYELSLQEIGVYYSGHNPAQRFADYIDSVGLIWASSQGLIPGSDCPDGATFIDLVHLMESSREPKKAKSAFCIFEFNTGVPLRRHMGAKHFKGYFYEGMADVVLILRTVVVIANYDYFFDFVFHQNGVIDVRVMLTGYISSSVYTYLERPYGAQIHELISGPIHHHMFHFKADMDIKGTHNSFETLDILQEDVSNTMSTDRKSKYHQTKFVHNLKTTERQGAYKFNFDIPKYLVIYNDKSRSKFGNARGYRVSMNGMSKQVISEGTGNEPSLSWARYQMAVTQMKDDERESSSVYAVWDANDPVVQFQRFIDDDESIINQDLVAWISLGLHHIPHTEDLPVTTTPGVGLSFSLLPYNYFDEDPAISSGNAIRIDWKKKDDNFVSDDMFETTIELYGVPSDVRCVPP